MIMSSHLAELCSYDSDSEPSPGPVGTGQSPLRGRPSPSPRVVADSPAHEHPPMGAGDWHHARLSLFPRIQMISGASEGSDAPSAKGPPLSTTPGRCHIVETSSHAQQPVQALCSSVSEESAISLSSIHQPSPRLARLDRIRAIRPERSIRVCRKETSSVVSAASSGGPSDCSRTSSPTLPRQHADQSAASPAPLPSSLPQKTAIPASNESIWIASASSPAMACSYQSDGPISGAHVHPRFRRYIPAQSSVSVSVRDQYASDSGESSQHIRAYTPDSVSSPESVYPSLSAANWNRLIPPSERCQSPLSDLESTPPRTPSPTALMYASESDDGDGEDELADDDDDEYPGSRSCSLSSSLSTPTRSTTSQPPLPVDSQSFAECRWRGCGALFPRSFGPVRKSYAPFNQMHYDVMDHYRSAHGLDFHTSQKTKCQWEGCTKLMTGKSFSRHLLDAHMHLEAHRCERCGISFSRRDAVTRHMRKCDGNIGTRTIVPGGKPRVDKTGRSPWAQPMPIQGDAAMSFANQYMPPHRSSSEEPLAQVVRRGHQNNHLPSVD